MFQAKRKRSSLPIALTRYRQSWSCPQKQAWQRIVAPTRIMSANPEMNFPINAIRSQFPALQESRGTIFFDNAAGAQLPARVVDAVRDHLVHRMVQRGGPYALSREVDDVIERARTAVADLINAQEPNEIVFGLNGTSFMRLVSQTIGEQRDRRNEIIVTELDHEANISVWLDLQKRGFTVRFWPLTDRHPQLDLKDLVPQLSDRTRLVAVTWASNATGSLVDVAAVAAAAHAAGAEVFVDAVHYLPHGPIDVQSTGIDYMACSTYKAFAPHMGFGWGRKPHLDKLPAFREYFIPDGPTFMKTSRDWWRPSSISRMSAADVAPMEIAVRRFTTRCKP